MAGLLVENQISDTVPGAGTVRWGMDFGNMPEILGGDLIDSCAIVITPVSPTPASPALTYDDESVTVTGGYLVSAEFSGGAAGTYTVKFTPTLVSGQVLPPRTGVLRLE